jgi:hypothetical protein
MGVKLIPVESQRWDLNRAWAVMVVVVVMKRGEEGCRLWHGVPRMFWTSQEASEGWRKIIEKAGRPRVEQSFRVDRIADTGFDKRGRLTCRRRSARCWLIGSYGEGGSIVKKGSRPKRVSAFDKLRTGLEDAIAYQCGYRTLTAREIELVHCQR